MLRIGAFSILANINIRTLRFYDEEGLLPPARIDSQTGYRYYAETQLAIVARIQALKAMGMSLQDIKQLTTADSATVKDYLTTLYEEKLREKEKLETQLTYLETTLNEIETNVAFDYNGIVVKQIPARNVAVISSTITDYSEQGILWQQLDNELEKQAILCATPSYSIAYYRENKDTIKIEVQRSVISLGKSNSTLTFQRATAILCATIVFEGQYEDLTTLAQPMANWLKNSQYQLAGPIFHIYHNSPNTNKKNQTITEICYPIEKKH